MCRFSDGPHYFELDGRRHPPPVPLDGLQDLLERRIASAPRHVLLSVLRRGAILQVEARDVWGPRSSDIVFTSRRVEGASCFGHAFPPISSRSATITRPRGMGNDSSWMRPMTTSRSMWS